MFLTFGNCAILIVLHLKIIIMKISGDWIDLALARGIKKISL